MESSKKKNIEANQEKKPLEEAVLEQVTGGEMRDGDGKKECPYCKERIPVSTFDTHIEICEWERFYKELDGFAPMPAGQTNPF